MVRRFVTGASVLACSGVLLFGILAGFRNAATAGKDKDAPGKDVFGPTKVWSLHLEIPAREYEALQPRTGGFGFPGKPPAPPPKDPKVQARKRTQSLWHRVSLGAGQPVRRRQDLGQDWCSLCG
jgi:hypothetical protein